MVGEQFDDYDGDMICGSVVNIRTKGDKISLWTKDAKNDEANRRIGYAFLPLLLTIDNIDKFLVNNNFSIFRQIMKQKLGITDHIYYEVGLQWIF